MLHCYVHIPFCRTRCPYCDFFLVTRDDLQERFFSALCEETLARSEELAGRTIRSVHFGGGTPSLVPVGLLGEWLETLSAMAVLPADAEITLEANPEDLSPGALRDLASLGVNRLSIGVQSFLSGKLASLGRAHDASDALRVTQAALETFDNVSLDLICGAEGETPGSWTRDLELAAGTGAPHVSVYMLTLEKNTLLEREVRKGRCELPGEEAVAGMYASACEFLGERGFLHYEVSNFSRPGFFSRYNLGCWHRESYLGFGPSAHSLVRRNGQEWRSANACSLIRYMNAPGAAALQSELLSPEERHNEQLFLSLRLSSGLDRDFLLRHHENRGAVLSLLERFRREGLLEEDGGIVRVTEKGFLFADLIAEELCFPPRGRGADDAVADRYGA